MTAAGAGISAAGPMWHEFMAQALATFPHESFPQPEPVTSSKIMLNGNNTYTPPDGGTDPIPRNFYYVDRKRPLGPMPSNPGNDPQFINWDWPVLQTYGEPTYENSLSPHLNPTTLVNINDFNFIVISVAKQFSKLAASQNNLIGRRLILHSKVNFCFLEKH